MKLCRFELLDEPGRARSGIFHDSRLYETDGNNPVAIHEMSKVRVLSPIGRASSIRLFNGESFVYVNASPLVGPLAEIDAPAAGRQFDFEVRIATVVKDFGEHIEPDEALGFVLGFMVMINYLAADRSDPVAARDFPVSVGPTITTIDEFVETGKTELSGVEWTAQIKVGDVLIASGVDAISPEPGRMILRASETIPVFTGDLLASNPLAKPPLAQSPLKRHLQPGDRIHVEIDGLGVLVNRIV